MNARPPRPSMGGATEKTTANKVIYKCFLDSFDKAELSQTKTAAQAIFSPDALIDAAHPINHATGGDGYFDDIIAPMAVGLRGF